MRHRLQLLLLTSSEVELMETSAAVLSWAFANLLTSSEVELMETVQDHPVLSCNAPLLTSSEVELMETFFLVGD